MSLLSHLHVNVVSLFGLTLLLGLIGGELAKRTLFLPTISGYIAIGFLVGPNALNIVTPSLLSGSRIFVDISLGLILFDIGRHLDFKWLQHDRGIIWMSLTESSLTFVLVFIVLIIFNFSWINASLAATIAIATSPAVILMVANDLSSKGPVTRRTFILTSLNNLYGLLLFILLLPITHQSSFIAYLGGVSYRLIFSILIGFIVFGCILGIAYFIGKRKENQFVLFVGGVMFAIGIAVMLNLSSMLTLFTLGVAARNFNYKNLLIELDWGWLAKLFFIILFVVTGVHLQLKGLFQATTIIVAFLLARTIGKACGIWLFSGSSRLTTQQTWALCFALTPMAGVAVGMSNMILDFNPTLGYPLIMVLTTVITILNIFGPIATQFAFVNSNEALSKKS